MIRGIKPILSFIDYKPLHNCFDANAYQINKCKIANQTCPE